MIVTGDAGVGKTHLLCDVARGWLAQHCPTVVLMGQQFMTNDPPWIQARALMDLDGMPIREFVGALEAAAQAAGSRALRMIDAVNEGAGHEIWPRHLASLLAQLGTSPWVGVVLSVRTPYVDDIIPTEVQSSAYELPHEGFKGNPYAAVERFCEHYGLDFPATPLLRPDFDNPLFLKTVCEGLKHRRLRRIPVGAEGISTVFGRYLDAVDAELAERLDYDPQAGIVTRALDAIASELAAQGTRWLPRSRAQELVDALTPEAGGFSRTLYRALVDKGLLTELPGAGRDDERVVQIGYEWFADYLIAKHLIGHFDDADTLIAALAQAEPSSAAPGSRTGTCSADGRCASRSQSPPSRRTKRPARCPMSKCPGQRSADLQPTSTRRSSAPAATPTESPKPPKLSRTSSDCTCIVASPISSAPMTPRHSAAWSASPSRPDRTRRPDGPDEATARL